MPKAFRIKKGTDICSIPELPFMLRLMMSVDAMKGAVRWTARVLDENSPEATADLLISVMCCSGWAGEAICQIKKGNSKKWICRSMLEGNKDSLDLWDEITSNDPPALICKIHRIRSKYFAHWDEDVAKSFIEQQASSTVQEVFIVSSGDGRSLETTFPWSSAAIANDLVDDPEDEEAVRSQVREIGQLNGKMITLLSELIVAMAKQSQLSFEPVDEPGE